MKAQTEITRLQDAKALKEIGVPCNTPVAHHKFSLKFSRHWRSLAIANGTSSEIEWRDIPVWFDEFMSKPGVEEILVEGEGGRPFCHDNRRTDTPQDVITKGSFLPRYSAVT
jgi:hypothetical protein